MVTATPGEDRPAPAARPLRVLMPRGMARIAKQSGIGAAIRHQEQIVRSLGHEVVSSPLRPFDVAHLNTPFPDTLLLAWWARLRGATVLMWAHSTEEDFRDSFTGANRIAPLFRRWIALLYRRGDAVVTPTNYSRRIISAAKYGIRRRMHVLSNGVDTSFFRPDPSAHELLRTSLGLAPESRVVMSVGIQMVRKGILDWVQVARSMPTVTFVWYGHTDPRLITKDVAAAIATAPENCLFPGYVGAEVLRDAYAGSDVFCFLTTEETEGIVLLEALACGTPVLLRDIPIYRDWLPDGEVTHMVPGHGPGFPGAVREKLTALLDGELADLTAAGREAAAEVSLDRVAERLAAIYDAEQVISRS